MKTSQTLSITLSKRDVTLREHGTGVPIFIFPGMEGSGESCLHLVQPVIAQLEQQHKKAYRMVLIDYSNEQHRTLQELITTLKNLTLQASKGQTSILWGQSFGNLLAAGVAVGNDMPIEKLIFVSPFTNLPAYKAHGSTIALAMTPNWLYQTTSKPFGRFIFGPVGDQSDHCFFTALENMHVKNVLRRTSWLRGSDFSNWFHELRPATKVWLGDQDRLIDLPVQQAFFMRLAANSSHYHLSMVAGSGHVILPTKSVTQIQSELQDWLIDRKKL